MLIGNAPCSWGINYPTGNRYTWEQYLDQVAAAGYRGTELGPYGFLPKDPTVLSEELEKRGLMLIGAAHVHTLGDAGSALKLMATLKELATLLRAVGSDRLILMDESNTYPRAAQGVLDQGGWRALTTMVREARQLLSDHGVSLTFHPHVGTAVEREAQIDRLLDETDVDLCFDVGHHAFWGQDPLAYMEKVWERIGYMHLKNVDRVVRQRVLDGELHPADAFAAGAMCPLPDGVVDIKAVLRLLESKAYVGPVVVEQDPSDNPADSPLDLAARNRRFLEAA
ncbi:MAG: sugar phosphate isomerase/epimerase family protein [Devosia sp.]